MTDVKTDLVPSEPPRERSLATRVARVVKSRLSGPAESQMISTQLERKRQKAAIEDREQLARYRQEVGELGTKNALESDGKVLDQAYEMVKGAAHDLLGILNAHRQEGPAGYFRREKVGEYKKEDEEWVHLPRSLPDGSHVVIRYESRHTASLVPSFMRKPKDVSQDLFYEIRVFVVPAEDVDLALSQNDLYNWSETFGKTEPDGSYTEPKGRYWSILNDSTWAKPIVQPLDLVHFVPGDVGSVTTEIPISDPPNVSAKYGKKIGIALGSGSVWVDSGYPDLDLPSSRDGEVAYAFDKGKLLLPGEMRTEKSPDYLGLASKMVSQLEEVVQLATT